MKIKRNKTVIVTGASRGIGRKTAELFALHGYNVLINYNSSPDQAENLAKRLARRGLSVRTFQADVSQRDQVESMVDFCLAEFGSIDVLVNNAGIAESRLFTDLVEAEWDLMMNVHLKGAFNCSQSVVRKYMLDRKKGKIINVSSIWGMVGASCEVHYSTAKAGLIGFTKALAKELGPSNIQVNCVAPGVIKTEMLNEYSDEELDALKFETPLMRLGTPKDVAETILFLASEKASFITGQVISPNGGYII